MRRGFKKRSVRRSYDKNDRYADEVKGMLIDKKPGYDTQVSYYNERMCKTR